MSAFSQKALDGLAVVPIDTEGATRMTPRPTHTLPLACNASGCKVLWLQFQSCSAMSAECRRVTLTHSSRHELVSFAAAAVSTQGVSLDPSSPHRVSTHKVWCGVLNPRNNRLTHHM